MKRIFRAAAVSFLLAAPVVAQDSAPLDEEHVVERLGDAFVRVLIHVQYHDADPPNLGVDDRSSWGYSQRGQQLILEERPVQRGGYLLDADTVVMFDQGIPMRFVKSITVEQGDFSTGATVSAFGTDTAFLELTLENPVPDAEAVLGDIGTIDEAVYNMDYGYYSYRWSWGITRVGKAKWIADDDIENTILADDLGGFVLDKAGEPIGLCVEGIFREGDTLDPSAWDSVPAGEFAALLESIREDSGGHLLRTKVQLRSPKSSGGGNPFGGFGFPGQDASGTENETEWSGVSVALDTRTLLVLAEFPQDTTARIESITVFPDGASPVAASFSNTLKDFGAFIATLDEPLGASAPLNEAPIHTHLDSQMAMLDLSIRGESRSDYISRVFLGSLGSWWRGMILPTFPANASTGQGSWRGDSAAERLNYLYDLDGRLVAIPVSRRALEGASEQYSYQRNIRLVPVTEILAYLASGSGAFDPSNVPLTEEEENRLAWLGVELQPLSKDLARMNSIAQQTNDGSFGALVTFIYPGSPAKELGLRMGDVVARIHAADRPRPLEVSMDGDMSMFGMSFPWDQLGEVPVEFFDQIPPPWPLADNSFNTMLTDLGFGNSITIELYRGGEAMMLKTSVAQGPPYYAATSSFKSEDIGMSTKDLTYEVRRFFRIPEGEPGVIIAKVEPGEPAAIAGLKPYEIVTHVNNEPVGSIEAFEKLIGSGGELQLSVKRMNEKRIVKIRR